MAGEGAFQVEGLVVEVMPNGTYRVQLVNGHRLTGFLTGRARREKRFRAGEKVRLQVSPYDLSEGRIMAGGEPSKV